MILAPSQSQFRAVTTQHSRAATMSAQTLASLTHAQPKIWITQRSVTLGWTRTKRKWSTSAMLCLTPFKKVKQSEGGDLHPQFEFDCLTVRHPCTQNHLRLLGH